MRVVLADVQRLRPFLEANEAENNMFLGRLLSLPPQAYLVHLERADQILLACLYVRRHALLAAAPSSGGEAGLARLVEVLTLDVPGVVGPARVTHEFARLWSERRGCQALLSAEQRIYRLTEVIWPVVPGLMRLVQVPDHGLLSDWLGSFHREALPFEPFHLEATRAEAWGRIESNSTFFWEVEGRPVALAALARPTAHGICVNAVYTPPEERGRGYASALVAAVSAEGLRRGKSFCMLYTDLSNPTSNRIYPRLGYQPLCDACTYRFNY